MECCRGLLLPHGLGSLCTAERWCDGTRELIRRELLPVMCMRDFIRLLKAWLNGTYRAFPWATFFVLILVGVYAINPFDIIPDFIPFIGVVDDAAMLGFLVRALMRDVQRFRAWEASKGSQRAGTAQIPA